MDGWMAGWMDGCTDGRTDGQTDGQKVVFSRSPCLDPPLGDGDIRYAHAISRCVEGPRRRTGRRR